MRHSHKPRVVWLSIRGEPIFPGKVTICTVCGAVEHRLGADLKWGDPLYNARYQRYPEGAGLHLTGEPSQRATR